jgi:hypothetical protein
MLRDTGSAEVVGDAADRDDQSIVGYRALGRDRASFVVECRGQPNSFPLAIEPDHLAEAVAEAVPMRLREVVELMLARVQTAGGNCMQERLPQMHARTFHERNARAPAPSKAVAQPRGELKACSSSPNDYNAVKHCRVEPFRQAVGHGSSPSRHTGVTKPDYRRGIGCDRPALTDVLGQVLALDGGPPRNSAGFLFSAKQISSPPTQTLCDTSALREG